MATKVFKAKLIQTLRVPLECIECHTKSWIPESQVYEGQRRWCCYDCGKQFVSGVFNDPGVIVWRDWHWVNDGTPPRKSFRYAKVR